MKKTLYMLAPALLLFSGVALAQEKKKEAPKKAEKKEIVIEEKSTGKSEKMVIVIDGDKVTINGKPSDDYKGKKHIVIDDDIVISGDRVHVPRKHVYAYGTTVSNKAMLGVVTREDDKGAKVNEVIKESAAEKAGIKEGDIITKINDAKVEDQDDLVTIVGKMKPNDVADVTFLRDGKEKKVKATLGKSKTPTTMTWNSDDNFNFDFDYDYHMSPPMAFAAPKGPGAFRFDDHDMWVYKSNRPKYGMSIEDYADGDGVKINDIDSASNAEKAGLKVGDIIVDVDGKAIKGTDALRESLMESKEKATISMKVLRNGATESVTVRVPKVIKKADL